MRETCGIRLPFGPLQLTLDGDCLIELRFVTTDSEALSAPLSPAARQAADQLHAWCADARHPLIIPHRLQGTPFQLRVWAELAAIPLGETRRYGDIARTLATAARAVGQACGRNPLPLLIPCHRVIAAHGLGGFNQGRQDDTLTIKRWLLEHERQHR